jgi:arylsulfatase B
VRVNALAAGGLIPAAMRGKILQDWTAMEDLYATYCGLAGVGTEDDKAKAANLPPVDGLDLWPLLSGANATGPRTEVWLGSGGAGDSDNSKDPIVQAYIRADGYKVIYGNVIENTWTGPFYPNATTNWCDTCPLDCGTIDKPTCLFNVLQDPTEHDNLAAANPAIVKEMAARLAELTKGIFAPDRGQPATDMACTASKNKWGGFVGWFTP